MLTEFNFPAFEYICLNMREIDATEIFAVQHHDSPLQLAYEAAYAIRNKGRSTIAWSERSGRPAAVAVFTEQHPGVWEVWMFGTDDFKDCAVELLRWFRKTANEILSVSKGHRLQCDSRIDHDEAHKMLRAFGAIEECRLKAYGKDGSDYIRFVWFAGENDAVLKPHFTRAA